MPKFYPTEQHLLSNGIPVILQHSDTPAAATYWWVRTGSADERGGVPADIADRFPRARLVESATLPYLMLNPAVPPLHVGIAVVDPRDDFHTAADERPAVR